MTNFKQMRDERKQIYQQMVKGKTKKEACEIALDILSKAIKLEKTETFKMEVLLQAKDIAWLMGKGREKAAKKRYHYILTAHKNRLGACTPTARLMEEAL